MAETKVKASNMLVAKDMAGAINQVCDERGITFDEFKKMCDDSVDIEKMPYYNDGLSMAREYVTHAYEVLYTFQHDGDWKKYLSSIKNAGFENAFPYIDEIYKMVLALEK